MRVFYLSDLHLVDGASAQSRRLENFLRTQIEKNDILILGGDIFDLFIGNKEIFRKRFLPILAAFDSLLAKGATIFYLEGNHDFHLEGLFSGKAGATVKAEEFLLQLGGRKIFVSHGDLIDPEDKGYRLLRFITRLGFVRWLASALPDEWVDAIGKKMSHTSRSYNNADSAGNAGRERLRSLYFSFAKEKVKDGAQHVLIGHSHLKDHLPIVEKGGVGEYLNLGFSSAALPYAILEQDGDRFLVKDFT